MKQSRAEYRIALIQAAHSAAVRILIETPTGVRFPHAATVRLLREAWLAGHKAAKQEKSK